MWLGEAWVSGAHFLGALKHQEAQLKQLLGPTTSPHPAPISNSAKEGFCVWVGA